MEKWRYADKPRHSAISWRRVRDSNPRSLSGHSISSAAPSTTRTTLHIEFFKHHLTRPSDKCKISMQDKREKFQYTPRIQPRVKPNPADESARKPQTFESRLFDHLSTAPYSILTAHPADPLEKCKISMQDTGGKFRRTPCFQPRVKPNPADESTSGPGPFECRGPWAPGYDRLFAGLRTGHVVL